MFVGVLTVLMLVGTIAGAVVTIILSAIGIKIAISNIRNR